VFTTVSLREGPQAAWLDRLIAATVAGCAIGCTWILWTVTPDAKGYDTHTQLGLQPCSWPLTMGVPCPTCGATTAACYLVHGQPWSALVTQPFGAAVALAGLVAGVMAFYCLVRRRSFLDLWAHLPLARIVVYGVFLLTGSWIYKYMTFAPP